MRNSSCRPRSSDGIGWCHASFREGRLKYQHISFFLIYEEFGKYLSNLKTRRFFFQTKHKNATHKEVKLEFCRFERCQIEATSKGIE